MISKAQTTEEGIHYFALYQIKNLALGEYHQKGKRKPSVFKSQIWWRTCARILEDSYKSIIKRKISQLKMGKETEYIFLQRRYTNGQ